MTKSSKLIAIALIMMFSVISFAHKMNVEAYVVSGSKIKGSASYHTTPVVNGKVKALAPDGKVLAEATTDEKGQFSFKVEVRCNIQIVVIDGGHKGTASIPAEDLPESLPEYKGK